MKALKKNVENLKEVAERICSIDFRVGVFTIIDLHEDYGVSLSSLGRYSIGKAVTSMIPCNWCWSVNFEKGRLVLHIWY